MHNRTDLAVESYESGDKTKLSGVKVTENGDTTVVKVLNEQGEDAIGKPVGTYVTLRVKEFLSDNDIFDGRLKEFSDILSKIIPPDAQSVLVACLGNKKITADSLGPLTANYIFSTRHIMSSLREELNFGKLFSVSAVAPGVLGDTGIETAEIIKGIVEQIKPSFVIAVDALAAGSGDRLGNTVQFSDSGISPGSGVGNHRGELSEDTLGVPVIAIGIPTVVSTDVLGGKNGIGGFVTPREIDKISELGAKFIGMGINTCLQKDMDASELYTLVG